MTRRNPLPMSAILPVAAASLLAWSASRLLFGGHGVQAARPAGASYPVPMPHYPGARERPLVDQAATKGSSGYLGYFVTRDEPLAVIRFYEEQWRAAGYHVTRDVTLHGGHVSAVDVKAGVVRQVLCLRQGDHTLVFPSVTQGVPEPTVDSRSWDLPPVYPGAEAVTSFGTGDPASRSAVLMFLDFGSIQDNVAFYRTEMAARGWKLERQATDIPGTDGQVATLVFRKEGRECTINIMAVGDSKQVRVHILAVRTR